MGATRSNLVVPQVPVAVADEQSTSSLSPDEIKYGLFIQRAVPMVSFYSNYEPTRQDFHVGKKSLFRVLRNCTPNSSMKSSFRRKFVGECGSFFAAVYDVYFVSCPDSALKDEEDLQRKFLVDIASVIPANSSYPAKVKHLARLCGKHRISIADVGYFLEAFIAVLDTKLSTEGNWPDAADQTLHSWNILASRLLRFLLPAMITLAPILNEQLMEELLTYRKSTVMMRLYPHMPQEGGLREFQAMMSTEVVSEKHKKIHLRSRLETILGADSHSSSVSSAVAPFSQVQVSGKSVSYSSNAESDSSYTYADLTVQTKPAVSSAAVTAVPDVGFEAMEISG